MMQCARLGHISENHSIKEKAVFAPGLWNVKYKGWQGCASQHQGDERCAQRNSLNQRY